MRFKKSSPLTKIILLIILAYSTVTLVSLKTQIADKQEEAEDYEQVISVSQQENQRLNHAIATVNTPEGVAEVARNKLGMVYSDEILFYDMGSN